MTQKNAAPQASQAARPDRTEDLRPAPAGAAPCSGDKGDTPRSDEAEVYYSEIVTGRDGGLYWVKADFARQLERELADSKASAERGWVMYQDIGRALLKERDAASSPSAGGPSAQQIDGEAEELWLTAMRLTSPESANAACEAATITKTAFKDVLALYAMALAAHRYAQSTAPTSSTPNKHGEAAGVDYDERWKQIQSLAWQVGKKPMNEVTDVEAALCSAVWRVRAQRSTIERLKRELGSSQSAAPFAERIADAQAEMATWTEDRKRNVQLQGPCDEPASSQSAIGPSKEAVDAAERYLEAGFLGIEKSELLCNEIIRLSKLGPPDSNTKANP